MDEAECIYEGEEDQEIEEEVDERDGKKEKKESSGIVGKRL